MIKSQVTSSRKKQTKMARLEPRTETKTIRACQSHGLSLNIVHQLLLSPPPKKNSADPIRRYLSLRVVGCGELTQSRKIDEARSLGFLIRKNR